MEQLNYFEKAVKIVDKYGIKKVVEAIVLAGIFLFVIFYIPNMTRKIVDTSLEDATKKRELIHYQELENRRKIQPQIYSALEVLLTSTKADRAFIIELHNGSQNVNSIPFLHGTVTYEAVRDGVDGIDEEYQGLSLSHYSLSTYLHNNFQFLGTTDELKKIDKKIALKLMANDVGYVAVTTLHDGEREWGWFGVLYNYDSETPNNDIIQKSMAISSQTISKLLTNIHVDK